MKNKAKLLTLISIIFFSVSGGPYGLEDIVASVGPFTTLLLILILPLVWTVPEVMIVAELSSTYPVQGGYYRWVEMGLGKFWGFMEGWWSLLYSLIDLSLYPILFTMYLKILFPEMNSLALYFVELTVIWSCALLNIYGIKPIGYSLTLFKFFILFSFLMFIFIGFSHMSFNFLPIFRSSQHLDSKNFLYGLSLAFWNFIGWDNSSAVLHEVDKPDKIFFKALFITIPIIVFFYFFSILVGTSIDTDWQHWKFGQFSYIANSMNHPLLGILLAIGGMLMCLGIFNSLLLSSTRVFQTMAQDKFLPSFFSRSHKKLFTPHVSILFFAFMYSILVLLSFEKLLIYDVLLYLFAMLLEALALIALRRKNKNARTYFKIPFGSFGMYFIVSIVVIVILFVAGINIVNFDVSFNSILLISFLIFGGIPVYYYFKSLINKNIII